MSRLTIVGDALLDRDLEGRAERLAPDAPVPVIDAIQERPRAGGAGLAATLAAAAGHDVRLVCALGRDVAGAELRRLLEAAGVSVVDLGLEGPTPEKIRVRAGGQSLLRLDHGGPPAGCGPLDALPHADAILVSDYGRGVTSEPTVRAAVTGDVPLVWDPHPRGAEPVPGATLVTPNLKEAVAAAGVSDGDTPLAAGEAAARTLLRRWRAVAVCDEPVLAVPAPPAHGDPCGAGDCFAITVTARLAAGALPSEAVRAAVEAASAFVGRETPPAESGPELAARVRRAGGTVVATGGCFDLLHAGHVQMLERARALGDCLIVCLNSDASVARLKGPERPLVEQSDRAAVLAALACVDAVVVFDEDDPSAVLRRLRPHVWVKGGDYALSDLPEAGAIAAWGGRAVLVPYVAGRSTTRLIDKASAHVG